MECAALAACAQFRKVDFAQILFTADTLANEQNYDPRDGCLLYTSPSPRDISGSRMPSSA